jgi:hypothetical protein
MLCSWSAISISLFRASSAAPSRPGRVYRKQTTLRLAGRGELQFGRGFDPRRQVVGLVDVLLDQPPILASTVLLERHPALQGAERPGELEAIVRKPGHIQAGEATVALAVGQVGRREGECASMGLLTPHQHAANLAGHVHPLVEIKGQRPERLSAGVGWFQPALLRVPVAPRRALSGNWRSAPPLAPRLAVEGARSH